jgi:hypothetical protein
VNYALIGIILPMIYAVIIAMCARLMPLYPRWWPWAVYSCTVIAGWRTWLALTDQPAWHHLAQTLISVTWLITLVILNARDYRLACRAAAATAAATHANRIVLHPQPRHRPWENL